jgi:hypothetical protein
MCYNSCVDDTSPKNLISVITEKLKDRKFDLEAVIKIAQTIEKSGMSLSDCALLARMSPEELDLLQTEIPEVQLYLRLKRVQYKEKLLEVLHTQATTNKDVKIAMYLLEANFSEEYDPAAKRAIAKKKPAEDDSVLAQLVNRVRTSAPNSPVIESNTVLEEQVSVIKGGYDDISKLVHG